MNINLNTLVNEDIFGQSDGETAASMVTEHHEIMTTQANMTLTGRVLLISDPDPAYPGAMQVWSQTAEGTWVWVSPEGEVIHSACPIGD